jgi:hypothetical protein
MIRNINRKIKKIRNNVINVKLKIRNGIGSSLATALKKLINNLIKILNEI